MRRVVVTGLGAVTPVGNDVQTSWSSIKAGKSGIDYIKKFDTSDLKVTVAAEVKDFDPTKYIEKRDLRKTDEFTIYAVAAAAQAVEDSGIEGKIDPNRFGVYIGSGIGGMQSFYANSIAMDHSGPRKVSPYFVPMMIANMASGTVAIRFKAQGPCLPIVTACATGTHSIGEAFHAIKYGSADAIIAGGAEAAVTPLSIAGFSSCKALSTKNDPKTVCTPFDQRRDGFVMGEGAGILILEEYEHAKARGAKIYAEICGYGNSCDAYHITAPQPDAEGPSRAIKIAMSEAEIKENDKVYINAHGTSTPANDKTETLAIKKAFGQDRSKELLISSTKSMTGHMLGAAGGVEAVFSVLALDEGILPPTINYEQPDPECDLNYIPNKAVEQQVDFTMSTSLGFGGHNACIVFKKA